MKICCLLFDVKHSSLCFFQVQRVDMVDITQKRVWKYASNIAAVVCMVAMATIAIIFA